MAKLINGNGNKAIWSAQDADLIASICGNVTAIAAVGSQFSYTQEDANTIGVADGVIITKEGRRIQLDSGNVDLFTIPTGQLGVTSYYIIGYKLVQNSDTTQTCETFVQKMDNATDVITENTFKGGATEVYVSLYRVTQVGMNIDTVDLLLPSMNNLSAPSDPSYSIDAGISVDVNNPFTAPSDGYLTLKVTNNSAQAYGGITDSSGNTLAGMHHQASTYSAETLNLFVRKGITYKFLTINNMYSVFYKISKN